MFTAGLLHGKALSQKNGNQAVKKSKVLKIPTNQTVTGQASRHQPRCRPSRTASPRMRVAGGPNLFLSVGLMTSRTRGYDVGRMLGIKNEQFGRNKDIGTTPLANRSGQIEAVETISPAKCSGRTKTFKTTRLSNHSEKKRRANHFVQKSANQEKT